ncbi:MAG: hypothetical protein JWQ90_845 [Hydrocarboniphaga sp.]|uniref:hypothetical protein n=1 Tax=Hydrocarboniphaga sp. TaxID=2033016 RepID=UPI002618E1D0|nr:hypothetical protein [Hydrocarboniphaga sp.]MDB5968395.1 hypothetical protein [Hydrocarboniphaga sp.]
MYDAHAALLAIDQHTFTIMACLLSTAFFVFVYFFIAFAMARKQQVYVVPFIGSAVFLWHDFSFVLMYDKWFHFYNHWWVKMWWFALCATVVLEVVMLYQVYRYGHKELWPNLSKRAFGMLIVLGTIGIGLLWALVKVSLGDELFFITFAITASFSVPFHTAVMSRRQSRAGQSVVMELSTIAMLWSLTGAFAQIDAFFRSPVYLAYVATFTLWPLANIWLMRRLPPVAAGSVTRTSGGRAMATA